MLKQETEVIIFIYPEYERAHSAQNAGRIISDYKASHTTRQPF